MSTTSYLAMSDEDFLNAPMPDAESTETTNSDEGAADKQGEAPAETVAEDAPEEKTDDVVDAPEDAPAAPDSAATAEPNPLAAADDQVVKPEPKAPAEGQVSDPDAGVKPDPAGSEKKAPEPEPKAEAEAKPVDYEAFYKNLIGKPIKANGKELVLKTPEEVERMVQMGAGFGRKLQDIQPHLKTIRMLEKNNLLDENVLSRLIDIHNKNPEAIKSLIKESGIDPLDLNTEDNVAYTPTNHSVSDAEMRFQEALTDVQSRESGQETLQTINQGWDDESKKALWNDPSILGIIQSQRENGVYDTILAEIDRQKALGKIPHSTPFLQAYTQTGNELQASNGFAHLVQQDEQTETTTVTPPVPAAQPDPVVIATRPAAPKAQVQNSDKAKAASPTPTTSRKATTSVNLLAMADDDFLKTFENRL